MGDPYQRPRYGYCSSELSSSSKQRIILDKKKRSQKTVTMHISRKRIHNHSDPEIRLNGHRLEIKNTHKILGLTFENRLTWKTHIDEVKANASKRMNLQGMLLRAHEMMVLSEFGSAAYGSARDGQFKRLEQVHNKNCDWDVLRM
jgi:hypothetical protein